MAAEKGGARRKPLLQRLKKIRDGLAGLLRRARSRMAKHPLCNLGFHRWQMRGWGRCTRKRCDTYRSFGKAAGVRGETR